MYSLATTKVTILRGTRVDDVGDELDTMTPYRTGILGALIEKNSTTWDAATQERRTVRRIDLALPSGTDVLGSDQILDEETGQVYSITSLTQPSAVGLVPDLELVLQRVTSVTT
jgi:hypothetical protein